MEIDLIIDFKTPCLIERANGSVVSTTFRKIEREEVKLLTKGWQFNWLDPYKREYEVYGIALTDGELQGLIAFKNSEDFIDVDIVESAPHNVGSDGKYYGVGAHLFAIAAQFSFKKGFDGYISFTAKTDLVEHYKETLYAIQIGNTRRMYLDTVAAKSLVETYFKKESNL